MTIALLVVLSSALGVPSDPAPLLQLTETIPLPKVDGRIDHMAIDAAGKRLFLAALGNNTVEVLDLEKSERVQELTELDEPQGVAWEPTLGRLAVASGNGASLSLYAGAPLTRIAKVKTLPDADNVRIDAAEGLAYVGCGEDGKGALVSIGLEKGDEIGRIALSGHPESFQLEHDGKRIFVNIPTSRCIAVVDRTTGKVVATWPLDRAEENFPMALDEQNHRLFVGCRKPAELLVLDTESGKIVARYDCVGDTDDIFFDAARRRLYVIGGEGRIDVFAQEDADRYRLAGQIATAPGARTALFAAETGMLYMAVPHREGQRAEIRIFTTTQRH